MADWNPKANDLFLKAAAIENPAERQEFLDKECGGDTAVRREVESLLAASEQARHFLSGPAVGQAASTASYEQLTERPGTIIGPYKLLQQIGEGGFGAVFMAVQESPVRRQVALKVIKPGMDSAQVIARFESERQALALMDHPNIAKVLDAGATDSGRPYFVMELVKGVPITEFCDKNRMPAGERLKLFIDVCHAVQHAHHKGVIHRDIKPSNVMVTLHDGIPVVKVIDFGVAKATVQKLTERTLFTAYGQMIGTPSYMSPEQAEMSGLDIDTRSDVYSLGVLLYELLTGTTPLESKRLRDAGYAEMQRLIREEEPPRPSLRLSSLGDSATVLAGNRGTDVKRLSRLLAGDLDWIVMKSLEKNRNRRYDTPGNFAQDIERYLMRELVVARPPSPIYKLTKLVHRNKGPVIAASLVFLALLGGVIGTSIGLIRAERRRGEAETARAAESEQRTIAETERKRAKQAAIQTLTDYQASTDDAIAMLIGSKPELGPQERAYLEKTVRRWQSYAESQGDDILGQVLSGEGHFRVASLWQRLDRREEALTEYLKTKEIDLRLRDQMPGSPQMRSDLAVVQHNLGKLLFDLSRPDDARSEYEQAKTIRQQLADNFPDEPVYQLHLADTHNNLSNVFIALGRDSEAIHECEQAITIYELLVEQHPTESRYPQQLAGAITNLATIHKKVGKWAAARAEYDRALDVLTQLLNKAPADPSCQQDFASVVYNSGNLRADLGDPDGARRELERSRQLREELAGRFPAMPQYQQDLANSYNSIGNLFRRLGNFDKALAAHETARGIRQKLVGQFATILEYQQELAHSHGNLGLVHSDLRQFESAASEHRQSLELLTKLAEKLKNVAEYQQDLASAHNNLGSALDGLRKHAEARAEYEKAQEIRLGLVHDFPRVLEYQIELGGSYCNYGTIIYSEGRFAEAAEWFSKAIQTLKVVLEHEPYDVVAKEFLRNSFCDRAQANDKMQMHVEAVEDWDKTIELSPLPDRLRFRAFRATSLLQAGSVADAISEVDKLTTATNWSAEQWYDFACIFAVASGKIADQSEAYADRAMEHLRRAIKSGFTDAAHIAEDKDLDALRDRDDFKALIAGLSANPLPQPGPNAESDR